MSIPIGFSSPFDNFSGVILEASIPVFAKNKIKISKPKNATKTKSKYQVALYNAGKIKAKQKQNTTQNNAK